MKINQSKKLEYYILKIKYFHHNISNKYLFMKKESKHHIFTNYSIK